MTRLRSRQFLLGVTLSALVATAAATPLAASANVEPGRSEISATEEQRTMRLQLELKHALSLEEAMKVADQVEDRVVAYHFENGNVVGEYSPATGASPSEFIEFFQEDYGTAPRVTGIIVVRPFEQQQSMANGRLQTDLGHDFDEFSPGPVVYGGALAARGALNAEVASKALGSSVLAGPDWRPDQSNHAIGNSGSIAYFGQYFAWQGGGLYSDLPNGVGLEFEINQDNGSVGAPQNLRPFCFDTQYKHRHWANNENWTWIVTDWHGQSPSSDVWIGAYADYNDTADLCRTSSISIGLRYPKDLTMSFGSYQETALDIVVSAPRGYATSSLFSGNVQAVSSKHCVDTGNWMAYTDCMGVVPISAVWAGSPTGNYNRGTLNIDNAWYIPGACWATWDKGDSRSGDSC